MDKQFVETFNGIDIHLQDGWFTASMGTGRDERTIRDRTLGGCKRKLSKLQKPIDVMMVSHTLHRFHSVRRLNVVIDGNLHRLRRADTGVLLEKYGDPCYHYDAQVEVNLQKLTEEYVVLCQRWDAEIKKLHMVY